MSLDEGDADFAAARAYYAMFYAAETLLSKLGLDFAKHSGVITEFNRHFIKTGLWPVAHAHALRKPSIFASSATMSTSLSFHAKAPWKLSRLPKRSCGTSKPI